MDEFWRHFLPRYQRQALIPYQVERMWDGLMPRRTNAAYRYSLWRVWHLVSDNPYNVDWEPLVRGQLPNGYAYRHFSVPKRDGSPRHLAEPGPLLKTMQHNILANMLAREKPNPSAVGYRKRMSVADHLWPHAGGRTIITADVRDFFPSTTRHRVRAYWRTHSRVSTDDELQLLTNLTTYRGSLPQGAPTSPALSNLVNRELDGRLRKLTTAQGGTYTRYADDMVFSWMARARPPSDFEPTVRRILREYGYHLHGEKGWRVWSRADEPEFTGGRLTRRGGVDVTRAMDATMHELSRSTDTDDALRLMGYRGYQQMLRRR